MSKEVQLRFNFSEDASSSAIFAHHDLPEVLTAGDRRTLVAAQRNLDTFASQLQKKLDHLSKIRLKKVSETRITGVDFDGATFNKEKIQPLKTLLKEAQQLSTCIENHLKSDPPPSRRQKAEVIIAEENLLSQLRKLINTI